MFVYILRCADETLYIGSTSDVHARLVRHAQGIASRYTAARRPVRLVYYESFPTLLAALQRERQLKRWTRAKKEALVAADLSRLRRL